MRPLTQQRQRLTRHSVVEHVGVDAEGLLRGSVLKHRDSEGEERSAS